MEVSEGSEAPCTSIATASSRPARIKMSPLLIAQLFS